jgi:hypothetical protein
VKLCDFYPTEEELDKYLWEMANLNVKATGIEKVIIWASQAQDGAKRHGPRVKVSAHLASKIDPNDLFVLSIQDSPVILAGECHLPSDTFEDVKTWVALNKVALLDYWHGKTVSNEFIDALQRL